MLPNITIVHICKLESTAHDMCEGHYTIDGKVYATTGAWHMTLRCAWRLSLGLSEVLRTAFRAPRLNAGDLVTLLAKERGSLRALNSFIFYNGRSLVQSLLLYLFP